MNPPDRARILGLLLTFSAYLVVGVAPLGAQPLGMGLGRAHPELRWMEISTEHFVVIHPEHLADTARKAASIAEQVYPRLAEQMELEGIRRRIAITISDEDQIVNGFALPGKMFLWVHQNDGAARFSGTEKWLHKVIAHELQHDLWMEAAQDWTGIWSLLGTPLWFIEGLAEYETEQWGAYRSDLRVRGHILRNRHQDLDPHDSGFSRVRYLAETYGDSVITGAIQKRGFLGTSSFSHGFEEKAGITLDEFEEEWRRVASAYSYAIWSQKERVTDVGDHLRAPLAGLGALEYSPDGDRMAVLARPDARALPVLAVVHDDSTRARVELDHGPIDRDFGFSPDGRHVVYAKLHRSTHGGLLWDLKIADTERGGSRWITQGRRASHPHWSPDGSRVVFTAIDGATTNLYAMDPFGSAVDRLTDHPYDVQVFSPRYSPDGARVVYSKFEAGRGVDIAVMELATGDTRYLTENERRDLRPRWSHDGEWILFTADRNADHVPNLHRVPVDGGEADVVTMSDVGEAIFGMDVDPRDGKLAALAYATVDTVRLRSVPADRRAEVVEPVIDERLTSWRDRVPPIPVPASDPHAPVELSEARPYRAWRHLRPFAHFVLPSPLPWGIQLGSMWADASHKHRITIGADLGTDPDDDRFTLRGGYLGYDTIRPPLWIPGELSAWVGDDSRQGIRLYGDEILFDTQTGFGVKWSQPLNFGEHLYANHTVQLYSRFTDVDGIDFDEFDLDALADEGLPTPDDDYAMSVVGFQYRYAKRRPHGFVADHATSGRGLRLDYVVATEALGSDYEFQRLRIDGSNVGTLPWIGQALFARVRYQQTSGDAPPQDFTGLRAEPRLVPVDYAGVLTASEELLDIGDSYALRGYPVNVLGDAALMSSLELRAPLSGPLPVSAFGLSLGGLTGVLFHDHGRVWLDSDEIEARHTVGWELRLPIRLFRTALVIPSYGEGQTLDWEAEGARFVRDEYFRLAFAQGF